MLIFSCVDFEIFLVGLVGDTISDLAAKHHLITVHEVVHNVFKGWHESDWVNEVEKYLFIRRYLDSFVALYEVDETSVFKRVIMFPLGAS